MTLNDFDERNVVQKGSAYRFIDFQHVEIGHRCLWNSGPLYEGDIIPTMDQIGCPEMHYLGVELGLWKPRKRSIPFICVLLF